MARTLEIVWDEQPIVDALEHSTAMIGRFITSDAGSIDVITALGAAPVPPTDPFRGCTMRVG